MGVIGGGSWGTSLSLHLARKGYHVTTWIFEKELVDEIYKMRENKIFLPGYILPENISVTNDLKTAVGHKDVICCMGPSHVFRKVMIQTLPLIDQNSYLVSAAKGIENESLMRMTQILKEIFPPEFNDKTAVISGPSFAQEVAAKIPTAVVIASENKKCAEYIQSIFNSTEFRTYVNKDVIGVELAGSLKNIIAIATGISDGIGFGNNTRAALITRGLAEITRLGVAMGAKPLTFAGLAGIGDLVLTCSSKMSRNYRLGFALGNGQKLQDIVSTTLMVAEGVNTSKSALQLANKYNVEVPIIQNVHQILFEEKNPVQGAKELMTRELKDEWYSSMFSR
ncbi:NAD(P)-dependent glycerol-3-phosphate dehydrogenase [bacterium]|nr:NAD(P)-dependent glycerol-3-phosphate dehydrogenase [bacterium]